MTENDVSVTIYFSSGERLVLAYTHERWEKIKEDLKSTSKLFNCGDEYGYFWEHVTHYTVTLSQKSMKFEILSQ